MKASRILRFLASGVIFRSQPAANLPANVPPGQALPKILVVVEGQNDIEFLRRVSGILHAEDALLPDLAAMERRRELVLVPCGGDSRPWTFRLASLGRPEFHLYDRDVPPATQSRQQAADLVNGRPNCRAAITGNPRHSLPARRRSRRSPTT